MPCQALPAVLTAPCSCAHHRVHMVAEEARLLLQSGGRPMEPMARQMRVWSICSSECARCGCKGLSPCLSLGVNCVASCCPPRPEIVAIIVTCSKLAFWDTLCMQSWYHHASDARADVNDISVHKQHAVHANHAELTFQGRWICASLHVAAGDRNIYFVAWQQAIHLE